MCKSNVFTEECNLVKKLLISLFNWSLFENKAKLKFLFVDSHNYCKEIPLEKLCERCSIQVEKFEILFKLKFDKEGAKKT